MFTAFSRDQKEKVYVHHLIKEQSGLITNMILNEDTYVLVIGNSKVLPKSVEKAFVHCLSQTLPEQEARQALYRMKNRRRFYIESW